MKVGGSKSNLWHEFEINYEVSLCFILRSSFVEFWLP